jgi:thiamine kinase-like enzyme
MEPLMNLKIEEVVSDVDAWRKAAKIDIEPLDGGYTNHTYKVAVDEQIYVVRINGNQNSFLGLDRKEETAVISIASKLELAPKVLPVDRPADYLITEFHPAEILSKDDVHQPQIIIQLAQTLTRIHEIDNVERECSPYHLITGYVQAANQLQVKIPDELPDLLKRMDAIAQRRSRDREFTRKYCHNDFYTFNIIHDHPMVVVDWELSGYGDVFFDLATIPFSNGFDEAEDKLLLESYFGYFDEDQVQILYDMKFMNMLREVTWALLHSALVKDPVNHTMDYYGFALQVIDRLQQGHVTL